MDPKNLTLKDLKIAAQLRELAKLKAGEVPAENIPVKTSGDLTAEVPSEVQKLTGSEDYKAKIARLRAELRARRGLPPEVEVPAEAPVAPVKSTPIAKPIPKPAPKFSAEELAQFKTEEPGQGFGFSKIPKKSFNVGALGGLGMLGIPLQAAAAQSEIEASKTPGMERLRQAGMMAGAPAELMPEAPKTEEQYMEELKKRLNEA